MEELERGTKVVVIDENEMHTLKRGEVGTFLEIVGH